MNIYLLHGFLGLPKDWEIFQKKLQLEQKLKLKPESKPELGQDPALNDSKNTSQQEIKFISVNLYSDLKLIDFKTWAAAFNKKIKDKEVISAGFKKTFAETKATNKNKTDTNNFQLEQDLNSRTSKNILIGYSLGGRLALEIFLENPTIWDQVFLISSQFGLKTEAEKKSRLLNDFKWADKFTNENFEKVLQEWNQQPVLKDSKEPLRQEESFDKEVLAWILRNWSLAKHDNLYEKLRVLNNNQILLNNSRISTDSSQETTDSHQESSKYRQIVTNKINWFCAEKDKKYLSLKSELESECPFIKTHIIADSGHRIIFDQPEKLAVEISKLIK